MRRYLTAGLAFTLAIAQIGISVFEITPKNAVAGVTPGTTMLMPGEARTFGSGNEIEVCNEGEASVHMFASNSRTGISTEALLEPGRCAHNGPIAVIFKNDRQVPVLLHVFGGMVAGQATTRISHSAP